MQKMIKVVRKFNLTQQPKEYDYWLTQSHSERIKALEEIIHEYHQWQFGHEPRLQRIYSISQLDAYL